LATTNFLLVSATPLVLLGLRMIALRRLRASWSLLLDLVLLLVSVPLGIELIGHVLHFPDNPGDHSPGIGIAFLPLMLVWGLCLLIWLTRLALLVFGKQPRTL
jgi:hypothetical protein